jgi:hypothetical protein
VVSDLDLLSDESVSPALERVLIKLTAKYKDVNVWPMWCPSTELELLTQVTVSMDGDYGQHDFRISSGASFFDAFPKATKLTFIPSPSPQFWSSCQAEALERIAHKRLQSVDREDAFVSRASSFKNLESLELTGKEVRYVLRDLVRRHIVLPRVVSLNVVRAEEAFDDEDTWSQLAMTFPLLTALDVQTSASSYPYAGDDEYADHVCVRGRVLEEIVPDLFGSRADVKIDVGSLSSLSCLVMATAFLRYGVGAEWKLTCEGYNDDGSARPTVTQALLDLLIENPACEVELEGTVETFTKFKLTVKSV